MHCINARLNFTYNAWLDSSLANVGTDQAESFTQCDLEWLAERNGAQVREIVFRDDFVNNLVWRLFPSILFRIVSGECGYRSATGRSFADDNREKEMWYFNCFLIQLWSLWIKIAISKYCCSELYCHSQQQISSI